MPESEGGAHEPLVDISFETESDEEHAAALHTLATLDVETTVLHTLRAVQITQPVTLTLVISGETTMRTLNKRYRQHDTPTDVLSFPLLDRPLVSAPAAWLWQAPEGSQTGEDAKNTGHPAFVTPRELATNLGDIVICWPTALQQARASGHSLAYELLFLFCHGLLHLLGYDDHTEAGYTAMVRLQEEILAPLVQKG